MKKTAKAITCVSIGYQGRKVQDLCAELAARGVQLLLDVRDAAWSQRPEFRKQALAAALADHGVAYLHMKAAGNPFRPKKGERVSLAKCRSTYRRHLDKIPGVVEAVTEKLREQTTAVFCFEANHDHCHRSVLLEAVHEKASVQVARVDGGPPVAHRRDSRARSSASPRPR